MKKITAIQAQKRNPNRVNVHLDGEFGFALDRLVAAWLQVGQELDEARIASLQEQDGRERAHQQALLFLSYRARSESEIRRNLRKHEIAEAVIEETLERLRREGLADDRQFARIWVENRTEFRPRGRRALEAELRAKGLSQDAARSALGSVDDDALAYQAGRKKAGRLKDLEWNDFRRKMGEFLARRGFDYSVIAPTVTRIWNEAHAKQPHIIQDEEIA
jgi:regulatory protein